MPDWMSHILIGLILAELFNIRKKSLLVLGALLPDFLSKLDLLFFYLNIGAPLSFGSFHTPIVCFLMSILIAPLFRYSRAKTILLINLGLLSHFLADLTMQHYTAGMYLLFPFSMKFYSFNWLWPEQSIYVLIVSLFIYILVRFVNRNYISQKNV